jgi:hypothetical protein
MSRQHEAQRRRKRVHLLPAAREHTHVVSPRCVHQREQLTAP